MRKHNLKGVGITCLVIFLLLSLYLFPEGPLRARNPYKKTFFSHYSIAEGTQLDDLPSNSGHCGVCHFDFSGGGARNPYGLGVEVGMNNGLSTLDAIISIDGDDSDADGFTNNKEITDTINFTNTPTLPGLTEGNYTSALNVTLADILPYLTPSGATDTIPPEVAVFSPGGGEMLAAESYHSVTYSASDPGGIDHVDVYLSDDGGSNYKPVAENEPPGTGYSWFIPNMPGGSNLIKVVAYDNAGNPGEGPSASDFSITATPGGYVPSTLRDMEMTGTQPHEGAILDDPDASCATCHGNYDMDNEPWYNWRGSMMSQAARDPFFYACMAIAEQDAPSVGDICIRCHSPGGWQEGRSVDTSGDILNVKDRHGVQCDYCHRMVDFEYVPGTSPKEDLDALALVDPLPMQYANGQFINDPAPIRRGPYADAEASHQFVESPLHRSSDLCGTCHDVSNPVFSQVSKDDYQPNTFDQEHPDMQVYNMGPIERTYSEWSLSEYASTGVYAPQFAGDKPDGIVSTCQDCHMRDVTAKGANEGAKVRSDIGLHDMMGGNTFVTDIVSTFYPDEVDEVQLQDAKERALYMLQKAATMELTPTEYGVSVRITNETGHKLPSGYPEGRRMWINVKAFDTGGQKLYESGEYDFDTADLIHDSHIKAYETHPGLSPGLAAALGLAAGKSFHFVLNDTIYSDNRIPPRGFTNSAFESVQSHPVAYTYADGQYWDDTGYNLPQSSDSVVVTLYYQSTSKEYVEFLRDENTTNSAGQDLYDAWVAQGKCPPVAMVQERSGVNVTVTDSDIPEARYVYSIGQNYPNPFNPTTRVSYSLADKCHVKISVYSIAGGKVRTLIEGEKEAGRYVVSWDGMDDRGNKLSSGLYFIRYQAGSHIFTRKAVLLR
jgi:cytochrome c553